MVEHQRRRVLLVVEGQKQEPILFEQLFKAYCLDFDYEIYSYGTNIHALYSLMFESDSDPAELSLIGVLKEQETDDLKRQMLDGPFSDILLIFDYDPQDNRFNLEHLRRMQEYFLDSTDEGKLYINYPMVEACKHFKSFPDYDFLNRCIKTDEARSYKAIVDSEAKYQHFQRDFKKSDFDSAIVHSLVKGFRLTRTKCSFMECCQKSSDFDHSALLLSQNEAYEKRGLIPVIGTCLFVITDYAPDLVTLQIRDKDIFA